MNLVDVHAHMDYPPLDGKVDEAVSNAKANGVKVILSNGTNPQSNRNVKELSEKYDIIKPAYGFYPTHVQEVSEDVLDEELKWIEEHKPLALGEVGLDYKFTSEEHPDEPSEDEKKKLIEKQKRGFQKIITLAKKLDVPLIVHSRKAELDVIELLEASRHKKIIMHCFMGKKKYVKRVRENGWSFSIPSIVLYLEQLQQNVIDTPLSQLFLETDAPLLSPERGIPSEPANVSLSVQKIAELKHMNKEEVADQTYMNYQRMFL
jgi:TatD DNase family protein